MKKRNIRPVAIYTMAAQGNANIAPVVFFDEKNKRLVFSDKDYAGERLSGNINALLRGENDPENGLFVVDSSLPIGSHAFFIGNEYIKDLERAESPFHAFLIRNFTLNASWGAYVLGDLESLSSLRYRFVSSLLVFAKFFANINLALAIDPTRLEVFSAAFVYASNDEQRTCIVKKAAEYGHPLDRLRDYYIGWMQKNSFESS